MKFIRRLSGLILLAIYFLSCKPVPVSHWFPVTPREHYEKELYKAKLEETAAGQTWFRASKEAFDDSLFSIAPFRERFFLGDSIPAQSIRLTIPEGRSLVITASPADGDSAARYFIELYRIKRSGKPQRIDYLKENEEQLTYDNQIGDTLLLLLQTGLQQKTDLVISISTSPILGFPVASHDMSDVISFWGAERDRGARSHEGIDIKAKRGTPVIASEDGFITNSGTNNLGGKVIFLSPHNNPYSLYYAHLDSQMVSFGTKVLKGDTLGLVGNTGNAITTAPHLHFGIYARGSGAVNPLPFIDNRKEKIPGLPQRSRWLGDSARIRKKVNMFASSQFMEQEKIRSLPANTVVHIIGEMTKGYRVRLADGTIGYVPTVPFKELPEQVSEAK